MAANMSYKSWCLKFVTNEYDHPENWMGDVEYQEMDLHDRVENNVLALCVIRKEKLKNVKWEWQIFLYLETFSLV